ncbi:MAG TPA: hypothetical protein VF728_04255 [Nocardioides sp.]
MNLSHVPLRLATGAFILNSGLAKRGAPREAAEGMQGMASAAFPQLGSMEPEQFAKVLSTGEMALGAALLAPFVPSTVAGAGLTGFGASLVKMYLSLPGMTEPGSVKPTQEGTAIAKDVWLVGAGLTLLLGGLRSRRAGAAD